MNPYATISPENVSGSAITNISVWREREPIRERCSATRLPTTSEKLAAATVSSRLPCTDGQKTGLPRTRRKLPGSRSASPQIASSGTAKKRMSTTPPGTASSSRDSRRRGMSVADRDLGPARVDLCLLRRGGLHVERSHLWRGRQLVGDRVWNFHARHGWPYEALREDALPRLRHDEVQPQPGGVRMRRVLHQADRIRRRRGRFFRNDDGDRIAEPVRVLRLEPVVLVADPDRDLALDELRVRRGHDHAEDVARLVQ